MGENNSKLEEYVKKFGSDREKDFVRGFFSPIRKASDKGVPDCPYMGGYPCRSFDFRSGESVCSSYGDRGVDRCCWLPSWVKAGFHRVVFRGGKWYV